MTIDFKKRKRQKCANEIAYYAGLLGAEDDLKTSMIKLANCMTEAEEAEYLCIEQNKKASKSKI